MRGVSSAPMVILIWCLTVLALLLWSAAGWAMHALLTLGPAWLDKLPALIAQLPYPAVLERWLPNWQELLIAAAATLQTAFGWLGAAGVVLVWVVWATGAAAMLGIAMLLSFAVRRLPAAPPPVAAR